MKELSPVEKTLLWILKIGLWIIPFLPLYVSSGLLFPFITGKNFTFRIIIELCFLIWIGLAVFHKELRPRLSLLLRAVTIFIVVLFLADLFGPNPYRSFFANYERMEGFMMLGHLYLYFLMLVSVFRKRDWIVFFHITLLSSVIVAFIGLLQWFGYQVSIQGGFRVDSTIGNPTYLAAYLMFHLWLALILLYQFWSTTWTRFVYSAVFLFELLILIFTATRGAFMALLIAWMALLVFMVFSWNRFFPGVGLGARSRFARWRIAAGVVLVLIIVVPGIFWLFRNTNFVNNNNILHRLTNYSLQDRTIQSRFKIWHMSLEGTLERPILGWGQENYYLVFQKYYNPGLYEQEPWFDRSHNLVFDWLIHTGFVGLLSFLSIFAITFWALIRGIKNKKLVLWEGVILILLFTTHLIQDLFVFDNLNTYLLLFAFFAYCDYRTNNGFAIEAVSGKVAKHGQQPNAMGALWVSVALLPAFSVAGYFLHLKPLYESHALIQALSDYQRRVPLNTVYGDFQTALSYNTFGDTEVREQLANTARDVLSNSGLPYSNDDKVKLVNFAINELQTETSKPAKDVKHMVFLASILDRAGGIDPSYIQDSETILMDAIRLSPNKQLLYFELAQNYLIQNKPDEALQTLEKTVELEPHYQQAVVNTILLAELAHHPDVVEKVKPNVQLPLLDSDTLKRLASAYQQGQDYADAAPVYVALARLEPTNAQYHATAAALFAQAGDIPQAIEEAEAAARIDPSFAKEAATFVRQLQGQQK